MLKSRARQVKIQNTEIPFFHPHTAPYRYLGVDITPTFNWGPHVDRVLTEAKQKLQRLVGCPLSKAQKPRVLWTAVDPSITYSFAIGCMTELDISRLDAVRTRACKKINGLPVCTTSAMIHEDLDQAGLGMSFTHDHICRVSCKYLVRALNDKGPLGFTTQHLLLLQDNLCEQRPPP